MYGSRENETETPYFYGKTGFPVYVPSILAAFWLLDILYFRWLNHHFPSIFPSCLQVAERESEDHGYAKSKSSGASRRSGHVEFRGRISSDTSMILQVYIYRIYIYICIFLTDCTWKWDSLRQLAMLNIYIEYIIIYIYISYIHME